MLIYTVYLVVVSVLSFLLGMFSVWICEKMSSSKNKQISSIGILLAPKGYFHFWIGFCVWIFLVFGIPNVYEFGPILGRGYVIFVPQNEKQDMELKRLDWFGTTQSIGTDAYCFYTPDRKYDFTTLRRTFTVNDASRNKIVSFKIGLNVEYPKFIFQIARIHPPRGFELQNEILVFNNLGCIFQQADMPVEELPQHAVALAEKWLKEKGITAASVFLEDVVKHPNPERTVSVN